MIITLLAALAMPAQAQLALTELQSAAGAPPAVVAVPATQPVAMADQAQPGLPDRFTIHERVISLMDTFDLKASGRKFGKITEKFLALTKSFTYEDASGVCQAKARTRIFAWGTHVDVVDCQDRPIGAIKENILKSLFKVYTRYSILDPQAREIASSEKVEWISTDLVLRRADGRLVAKLHRPWLNILSDNWEVTIADHQAVDARLIVMIAAYKTSVDNDRRSQESSDDDEKDEK